VSSGWNARAATRPWRTPTGSPACVGDDLDVLAQAPDARRANEDAVQLGPARLEAHRARERVHLTAPRIALDGDVEHAQRRSRQPVGLEREQDHAGTGAEDRTRLHEPLDGPRRPVDSSRRSIVDDSPPGSTSASRSARCSGRETRTGSAPTSRSAAGMEREVPLQAQDSDARRAAAGQPAKPGPGVRRDEPRVWRAHGARRAAPRPAFTSHVWQGARPRTVSRARCPAWPGAIPC
jgi:hypothetical protein